MPVFNNPQSNITKNLTALEKQLGVDLKINKDGDLEISNLKDFKLVAGGANAAQALRIKHEVEPGGLPYHPEIGVDLQIGAKTKDAFVIKTQLLGSILKDPRFDQADINVRVLGNVTVVDERVRIKGTNRAVPLQFAVTQ